MDKRSLAGYSPWGCRVGHDWAPHTVLHSTHLSQSVEVVSLCKMGKGTVASKHTEQWMEGKSFVYRVSGAGGRKALGLQTWVGCKWARRNGGCFLAPAISRVDFRSNCRVRAKARTGWKQSLPKGRAHCWDTCFSNLCGKHPLNRAERQLCWHTSGHCPSLFSAHVPVNSTKRSNQSILKEINPEYLLEGLMLQLKQQSFLWPPDAESQLIGKDLDAGKDWGQEEKGETEDEMVGWHHRLNGWV